jgi:hypothetical protein
MQTPPTVPSVGTRFRGRGASSLREEEVTRQSMMPTEIRDDLTRRFVGVAPETPPDALWHYTNAEGLKGIVTNRTIWASHFAHLNDTRELRFGHELVARALESFSSTLETASPEGTVRRKFLDVIRARWAKWPLPQEEYFIASFCADGGNTLGQWRGYGAFGAGYSLGFGWVPSGEALLRVRYVDPQHVDGQTIDVVRDLISSAAALDASPTLAVINTVADIAFTRLWDTVMSTKNRAFEDEREWRVVISAGAADKVEYRATARGLIPYVQLSFPPGAPLDSSPLPINRVWVGPANDPVASVAAVTGFLKSAGYANADKLVSPSGISFRGP